VIVALFHSMFGLRRVELAAAERLRAAGHSVVVPDLFAGETASAEVPAGLALMDRIGWGTIIGRARSAVADLPEDAVLGGLSMGVGVVGALWPERLHAAAVFCLHAPTVVPLGVPAGTPVQLHVAADDERFAPPDQVQAFRASAAATAAAASVHEYHGAGHLFTDPVSPDHEPVAAARTWAAVLSMLEEVDRPAGPGPRQ
jgi:dienelactone hydrolase